MEDYAKALLSPEEYARLLAARRKDFDEIDRRLSEVRVKAAERRVMSLNGQGDGGKAWQRDLEVWWDGK